MRQRLLSLYALLALAGAGCGVGTLDFGGLAVDEAETDLTVDPSAVMGKIAFGETVTDLPFNCSPTYRAFEFTTTQRNHPIDIWVRSSADAKAWVTKSDFAALTSNDNADATTRDAHIVHRVRTPGTYYVVFKEKTCKPAMFSLSLGPTTGCPDSGSTGACQSRDAGANQYDSGAPRSDAGPAQVDSGTSPYDSGTPRSDAGLAQVDSGISPYDSGTPRSDAGLAQVDSGTSPYDSGTARSDAGLAQVDSGTSPYDSGTSRSDAGLAQVDSGASPYDSGTPRSDAGLAQVDSGASPYDSGTPRSDAGFNRSDAGSIRVLFDNTKAEQAGNADWVVDDSGPLPSPANPNYESDWVGGFSAWGVALARGGYQIETLSLPNRITMDDPSNPQDLSNYQVFVVPEPNVAFTPEEHMALVDFVIAGGGLFMIADHTGADRNNDGVDAVEVWNDLAQAQGNPFGITFASDNFTQTPDNLAHDSTTPILHGPFGEVSAVTIYAGCSLTLSPQANPSVRGVIWKNGVAQGASGVAFAIAELGLGRVAAIGDSSPADDGTGSAGDRLFNGWDDSQGTNAALFLNATAWLAGLGRPISP
ncbi:MAG: hypothetical protein HY901_28035 [Deltaproteobacteria bacterium]|nr:hypothetical protein [Deltaproteobacteria bacterium]